MIIKVNDTIRIKGTDWLGIVTEVNENTGRHYTVKMDGIPPIILYQDEIELMSETDSTLIGCIAQSWGGIKSE